MGLACGQRTLKGICLANHSQTLHTPNFTIPSQMYGCTMDESCLLHTVFSHNEKDFLPIVKYWSETGIIWKLFVTCDVLEVF